MLRTQVRKAFETASIGSGIVVAHFLVGGHVLRIEAAGSQVLEVVADALSHLQCFPGEVKGPTGLTLQVWATSPGPSPDLLAGSAMGGQRTADFRHQMEKDGVAGWVEPVCGTTCLYDSIRQEAWCCIRDLANWPSWSKAAPFRALIAAWLWRHNCCLAHASCVGLNGRALLLAGPGGSGKSTTALLCAARGWRHFADDYSLVEIEEAGIRAHPFYNTAKLTPDSMKFFPGWSENYHGSGGQMDKSVVSIASQRPDVLANSSASVAALIFPTTVSAGNGSSAEFHRVSSGEALKLLIPSSLLQMPTVGPGSFSRLALLVKRLPCWRLNLVRDPDAVVEGLEKFLHRLP